MRCIERGLIYFSFSFSFFLISFLEWGWKRGLEEGENGPGVVLDGEAEDVEEREKGRVVVVVPVFAFPAGLSILLVFPGLSPPSYRLQYTCFI